MEQRMVNQRIALEYSSISKKLLSLTRTSVVQVLRPAAYLGGGTLARTDPREPGVVPGERTEERPPRRSRDKAIEPVSKSGAERRK